MWSLIVLSAPVPEFPLLLDFSWGWFVLVGSAAVGFIAWAVAASRARATSKRPQRPPLRRQVVPTPADHQSLAA